MVTKWCDQILCLNFYCIEAIELDLVNSGNLEILPSSMISNTPTICKSLSWNVLLWTLHLFFAIYYWH